MPSTYTSLGTELMITGEKSGQWGTITNTNLQILEQIASGYVAQALTDSSTSLLFPIAQKIGGLFIMLQRVLTQYKLKQQLEQDLVFLLQIKDIKFYIPMGQMWWMS